jgi:hypothetical protein
MLTRESLQCQQCEIEKAHHAARATQIPDAVLYAETNENL